MIARLFPFCILALSVLASGVYFIQGDMRRGIYWAAASVITVSVTF